MTSPLTARYQPIAALHPNPRNARTHSARQIRQIANSIKTFGFNNPIIVDRQNGTIAGGGRREAAKLLGLVEVPTIVLEDLTEGQIRAYILADNQLCLNGGWDKSILAIELQHLLTIENLDFDVTITGFEIPEIDLIIGDSHQAAPEQDLVIDPARDQQAVSRPGDLWQLGTHRILCGTSLDEAHYQALIGKDRVAAVFADLPYTVKIDGHATGNGIIRHREFAMASGEMTQADFLGFLNSCLALLAKYSTPQSVHYLCMDWRNVETLIAAGRRNYDELLNLRWHGSRRFGTSSR